MLSLKDIAFRSLSDNISQLFMFIDTDNQLSFDWSKQLWNQLLETLCRIDDKDLIGTIECFPPINEPRKRLYSMLIQERTNIDTSFILQLAKYFSIEYVLQILLTSRPYSRLLIDYLMVPFQYREMTKEIIRERILSIPLFILLCYDDKIIITDIPIESNSLQVDQIWNKLLHSENLSPALLYIDPDILSLIQYIKY